MIADKYYNYQMHSVKASNQQHFGSKNDFSSQIKNLTQNSLVNRYQIKLLIVIIITSITSNLQSNAVSLLYANPVFTCQGLEGKISEEQACFHISTCQLIGPESITAKLQLYCGSRSSQRTLIQTLPGVGSWLGLFFINTISDRKGRKFSIVLSLTLMSIGCIISIIGVSTKTPFLLVFSQLLSGISGKPIYLNFMILLARFFKKDMYEAITILWFIISGASQISIGVLNHYLQSVQSLILIYLAGAITATTMAYFYLYQDPLYYFDTKQYQSCKQVCESISKQNGESAKEINQKIRLIETYVLMKENDEQSRSEGENNFNMYSLIRRDIIITVLVLAALGCFLSIAVNSLIFSIQVLNLSFNDNLLIIGGSKMAGNILAIWFLRIQQNRRRGFMYTSTMCGLAGIMLNFNFCRQSNLAESICLAILRISLSLNNNFYVRLEIDTFPQKYQGMLIGCVQIINVGRILAPVMAQTSINYHLNPLVSINVIKLTLGTLPMVFLRDEKIAIDDEEEKSKNQSPNQ